MITVKMWLQALYDLFMLFILLALFSIACISFPNDANAEEEDRGGIVVWREVPHRSAIRPSVAPGRAHFVDTSPDDIVNNALGVEQSKSPMASLKELGEDDFAAITTNTPQSNLGSENIKVPGQQISRHIGGNDPGSNVVQSTQGIGSVLGGSASTITGSVSRATTSISHTITGATGFLAK